MSFGPQEICRICGEINYGGRIVCGPCDSMMWWLDDDVEWKSGDPVPGTNQSVQDYIEARLSARRERQRELAAVAREAFLVPFPQHRTADNGHFLPAAASKEQTDAND